MRSWRRWRGQHGEQMAVQFLQRQGYRIQHQNYRCRGGEVDIVAWDGPTLVFIEVKARDGRKFGDGAEAVTAMKQRRIARLAMDYIARHRLVDCPCRFDVVSVQIVSVPTAEDLADKTEEEAVQKALQHVPYALLEEHEYPIVQDVRVDSLYHGNPRDLVI